MALTSPPSAPSHWGRWPQQMHGDYSLMEGSTMMPFDNRTTSSPLQRPVMAPQYMVTTSYSSGPLNSIAPPPHYQAPSQYQFGAYHGPPTPPHQSPHFKPEYHDRRAMGHDADNSRTVPFSRDLKHPYGEQAPSPAGSDSQASLTRSASNPNLNSKTITSNETLNPELQVNFETEVDELMKAIQRKEDKQPQTEVLQHPMTPSSEAGSEHTTPVPVDCKPRKRYVCDGPSCKKTFSQKTHLEIHRRTHTGDKPYPCDFPGCKLTFSQLGNLKTHVRRHTGERPFSCEQCGRRFAQRGNVRAHEQTHQGLKPFICKLDDCNKTFSQLGNMKTHQNNFHKQTLKVLTAKFAHMLNCGHEIPENDRDLFEYFATHYKNSNKGIKGRGKARTVAERKSKVSSGSKSSSKSALRAASKSPSTAPTPPVTAQFPLPQIPSPQQAYPHNQHHPVSHPGSLAAYSMSRNHPSMMNNNMQRGHQASGYDMFEMDGEHHPVQPSNPSGLMYENEHTRGMGFSERMY
ncbi:hypothetical protein BGZ63DRAFT_232140 [Mariannaea sp. PMI_226]|nr:hypothetical protein BGZ63DRAFT_232140 [Mariannaea sp. PMI_226]